MSKVITLVQAAELIIDGDMVALGGNVLHRAPMSMVRELVRHQKKGLRIVKTAGAMDIDLLCLGGCAASVDAGFVSYETEFGLASSYRKAVESGTVKANEHACYTVICALRAAQMGVPFMPVKGLCTGDLLKVAEYFRIIQDPFSGEQITVVKALNPDVAVIHVQEADMEGNVHIIGPKYEDVLISRAAKKVIVTAERIVPVGRYSRNPENIDIPGFLVNAVVHVPNGAAPCSCFHFYDIDRRTIEAFKALSNKESLAEYLITSEWIDRRGFGKAGGI